jgi:molybdenum cofactor guanylyltransferase
MEQNSAIVAVLAGGRGRRIGGDKAATLLAGRPLISYPLQAAREAGLEAVVVAKPTTTLPALEERVVLEAELPAHPLCGVLAALDHTAASASARSVVLLACDMPFLTPALLTWLASLDGTAMAELDGRPQPLLSHCMPDDRSVLLSALTEQSSLSSAIYALEPRILGGKELSRFGPPERLCFGVNDDEDLLAAEGMLA